MTTADNKPFISSIDYHPFENEQQFRFVWAVHNLQLMGQHGEEITTKLVQEEMRQMGEPGPLSVIERAAVALQMIIIPKTLEQNGYIIRTNGYIGLSDKGLETLNKIFDDHGIDPEYYLDFPPHPAERPEKISSRRARLDEEEPGKARGQGASR